MLSKNILDLCGHDFEETSISKTRTGIIPPAVLFFSSGVLFIVIVSSRIKDKRVGYHHYLIGKILKDNDVIFYEDLDICNMVKKPKPIKDEK